jgi:hypothetical protein
MLSPNEFKIRRCEHGDRLIRFSKRSSEQLTLAAEDKAFLVQAGLPEDAAPFLTCLDGKTSAVARKELRQEVTRIDRLRSNEGAFGTVNCRISRPMQIPLDLSVQN